ncbi:integrase catalytic domain-containing protein [Trichonephila clavipes]|nr:integrase catalytic domain-containing protein [Trichonephila clavipes]
MDILKLNKAKTSLKGSITRISTFMDNVSEHVDITELEVKLKKIDQLQRKIEELKELLFGLETANPTEEAEFEEDLYKCETRLDDLEKLDNESRKNFELSLKAKDVPTFDEFIAFLEQRETILLSVDKNCIVETKTILRKSNLSFKTKTNLLMNRSVENKSCIVWETEFGWIAGGRLQGTNTNNFSCYFLKDNDSVDDTLKLFFELESLGIKDDPCYRKDDQAMNIFKETVQYNNNRYVVELPFRKHWNELSNNISVAKQRFQSLWGRLRRDKTLYTQYKETIQDYLNQGIIEKVNDTEINVHKPMYYLPHQAIKKEGRVTTSTRIVLMQFHTKLTNYH